MVNYDMRRARDYIRDYEPTLAQSDIDEENFIVAGTAAGLKKKVQGFLRSLDNTRRGLALLSGRITKRSCGKALQKLVRQNKITRRKGETPAVEVDLTWFNRLPSGYAGEQRFEIEERWLSEERSKEITGLDFSNLVTYRVAAPQLIYVVSEQDLEESDTAVHYAGENRIWLNRQIPRNKCEKSREWRYYSSNGEDGFVPRWEQQGRDGPWKPSPKPKNEDTDVEIIRL